MTTTQIAVRLPSDLVDRLDHLVPAPHGSRSEAIRRAVELRQPITRLSQSKMQEACRVMSDALGCR